MMVETTLDGWLKMPLGKLTELNPEVESDPKEKNPEPRNEKSKNSKENPTNQKRTLNDPFIARETLSLDMYLGIASLSFMSHLIWLLSRPMYFFFLSY